MIKTVRHSDLFMGGPADPARTDSDSTGQLLSPNKPLAMKRFVEIPVKSVPLLAGGNWRLWEICSSC